MNSRRRRAGAVKGLSKGRQGMVEIGLLKPQLHLGRDAERTAESIRRPKRLDGGPTRFLGAASGAGGALADAFRRSEG